MENKPKKSFRERLPKILGIGVFVLVFIIFFVMEIIPDFSEELFGEKGPPQIFSPISPLIARWGIILAIIGLVVLPVLIYLGFRYTMRLFDSRWYQAIGGGLFIILIIGYFFIMVYLFRCSYVLEDYYKIGGLSTWVQMGTIYFLTILGFVAYPLARLFRKIYRKIKGFSDSKKGDREEMDGD